MVRTDLAEGVHWVGAVDWDIRDFHGYSTYRGTTYNAFLIVDEKITLVDTVKKTHKNDLLREIKKYVNPEDIDYVVINHVELDHSGSLPELMELIKPEKLICSPMGEKALKAHFHQEDWPYEIVKSNDEISLGKRTLQFIETRMLHWPDSMFTFIKEDGILFSSDAFGQHYGTCDRFDDEAKLDEVMHEAAKYYANILYLYSPLIQKLLKSVAELNLDIKMIAPDHGVMWRSNIDTILEAYDSWSRGDCEKKAVIVYDTMWQSTQEMAKAIAQGIESQGVKAQLVNLKVNHRSDAMTEVLSSKAVVLGSSTLNNGLLPRMYGFLGYMRGLKPADKIGAAFGSFGWSGEAVKLLTDAMTELKFDMIEENVRHKYVPGQPDIETCEELGKSIGKAVLAAFE